LGLVETKGFLDRPQNQEVGDRVHEGRVLLVELGLRVQGAVLFRPS
jgi:hypothetical protein